MSTVQADTAFDYETIKIELEAYLGFDIKAEPRLELWYNAAREQASLWLKHDFTDSDGVDVGKPDGVKLGIFEGVRAQADHAEKPVGVMMVKTGQLQETYVAGQLSGTLTLGRLLFDSMMDYLQPHSLEIQLG